MIEFRPADVLALRLRLAAAAVGGRRPRVVSCPCLWACHNASATKCEHCRAYHAGYGPPHDLPTGIGHGLQR